MAAGKRKFGFNLTPLKIPSRADNDALRKALDGNFEPVSSPESPPAYIDRQHISRSIQQELKAACRSLVEKTGNAQHNSQEEAIINFATLQRAAKHKPSNPRRNDDKLHVRSSDAKSDPGYRDSHKSEKPKLAKSAVSELALRAGNKQKDQNQSSEKPAAEAKSEHKQPHYPARKDSLSSKKHTHIYKASKGAAVAPPAAISERPQTAPAPPISCSESCQYSPLSASTDFQPQSASTAFTSVPISPLPKSSPKSFQAIEPFPKPSEASHLRIISNAEETRQHFDIPEAEAADSSAAALPNDRSFVSGLKDFVRNRSRSRSRSREPSTLKRTTSTIQGWRSGFNIRRKLSTSDLGDMSASVGTPVAHQHKDSKTNVDLNRALPPLPSLDTYKEGTERKSIEEAESKAVQSAQSTVVDIVNLPRPQTSAAAVPSTSQMKPITESPDRQGPERSSSLRVNRQTSITVSTAVSIPVRKFSVAESGLSSQDSCFSPTTTDIGTPKRSMDVMKAAALARTQSLDSMSQLNQHPQSQLRKESISASGAQKSSAASRHSSRPQSRGTTKPLTPARYTIIPHQRAPSQPVLSSRSAASSVVNLPPRPATRDASSTPTRCRMPSLGAQSAGSSHPPLPVNFSRKIEDASRPTTSAGPKTEKPALARATTVNEITALPPFPTRKHSGLRRMFSSISVRKPKTHDMSWMFNEAAKSPAGMTAA